MFWNTNPLWDTVLKIIIKTVWYRHKDIQTGQWARTESRNPPGTGQLTYVRQKHHNGSAGIVSLVNGANQSETHVDEKAFNPLPRFLYRN